MRLNIRLRSVAWFWWAQTWCSSSRLPKDPARRTAIAYSDRGLFVDESWAGKWFKYVTPETWKNGDLRPQLLSVDPARAQTAWDELEAAPLEIKIRYLCEFWASDVTQSFDKLQVPVLALVPGFDEKFLADPANGFAKPAFLDSWETLVPKHPQLELVKIPNARMLVLDDQPQAADEAIAAFMKSFSETAKQIAGIRLGPTLVGLIQRPLSSEATNMMAPPRPMRGKSLS